MEISSSAENYLKAIYALRSEIGKVRSIDVVRKLNFSKPSVSVAMKRLREQGLVAVDERGYISLLPPGEEVAARIYERHRVITDFLVHLGVEPKQAEEDACKM